MRSLLGRKDHQTFPPIPHNRLPQTGAWYFDNITNMPPKPLSALQPRLRQPFTAADVLCPLGFHCSPLGLQQPTPRNLCEDQ